MSDDDPLFGATVIFWWKKGNKQSLKGPFRKEAEGEGSDRIVGREGERATVRFHFLASHKPCSSSCRERDHHPK